ncbi:MAG: BCCT family transporter [Treponema sp.]|nr:BCCT family transporter [Treponema sp.]
MKEKTVKEKTTSMSVLFFPLGIIGFLAALIFLFPDGASGIIDGLFDIFTNKLGVYYIVLGLFVLSCSIYIAVSKYGNIKLGSLEKPRYPGWKWGSLIFTATMAADIIFWSLIEWGYYYGANPMGIAQVSEVQRHQIASSYPLFHWGPIPWAFYILPAAAYAYMFFVWKGKRQTLAEACRPVFNDKVDGILGKIINIVAVVGLLGGTATTFAFTTPLMTSAFNTVFGFDAGKGATIIILLITGIIFTVAVVIGMKAITKLAIINIIMFFALLAFVFIFSGSGRFIIESGVSGIGNMLQNFVGWASWTDPLRLTEGVWTDPGSSGFPQTWTIFYWAYWIAWFIATPFFIAKISEGRTLRNMIGGAYFYGIAGTFTSFIIFGNFGLHQQVRYPLLEGGIVAPASPAGMLAADVDPQQVIIQLFDKLPLTNIILLFLIVLMIVFYASTFDAITMVVAGFSRRELKGNEYPEKKLRIIWAFVFIILPIALIWAEQTVMAIRTVSIVVAFPLSFIMLIIIFGFLKELSKRSKLQG